VVPPFVAHGGMVAEGGVAAAGVVEALDGLEDSVPCLGVGADAVAVDELALEGGEAGRDAQVATQPREQRQ
jgi:hypothetical protein